jgi:hypothetical protein
MFENKVPRIIFGTRRKKTKNAENYTQKNFTNCTLQPNIFRGIKSLKAPVVTSRVEKEI